MGLTKIFVCFPKNFFALGHKKIKTAESVADSADLL